MLMRIKECIYMEHMHMTIEYVYTCLVDREGEQHLGHLGLNAPPPPHEGGITPEAATRALAPAAERISASRE